MFGFAESVASSWLQHVFPMEIGNGGMLHWNQSATTTRVVQTDRQTDRAVQTGSEQAAAAECEILVTRDHCPVH